jgi:hypothetical protein
VGNHTNRANGKAAMYVTLGAAESVLTDVINNNHTIKQRLCCLEQIITSNLYIKLFQSNIVGKIGKEFDWKTLSLL